MIQVLLESGRLKYPMAMFDLPISHIAIRYLHFPLTA